MTAPFSGVPGEDPIAARLRASRLDLLDLTLRNPLLNYRASKRRGLDIIDETSAQVFSFLFAEGGSLRFHETKKAAEKSSGEGDLFFLENQSPGPARIGVGQDNPPNSLATPYTAQDLESRLLATHADAKLTLQEQGVNTLFLVLGMLQWRDSADSTEDRLAPLVVVPVQLDRKTARSQWQLSPTDEDAGINLSLVEKLKEFGIRLNPEHSLHTVEDLGNYFAAVEEAVAEKEGWAVARDRIALSFFSFGKFLMYKDLDTEAWPSDCKPGDHPLLRSLLGEGFRDRGSAVPPEADMDALRPAGRIMEVMDSDGSQAEALADVATGRSLAIQGPPGTGKSQTISNMIAEAVHEGKRVLFVAEKLAALEVVKRRLESAGLGELCLELHSNKASKKAVATDVARTLGLGRPKTVPDQADGLADLRSRLNQYARSASMPIGRSGIHPFQAIGILERLGARPEPLPKAECPAVADWSGKEYDAARSSIQDLAAKIGDLGIPARHPFNGCGVVELMPGDLEKIEASLGALQEAGKGAREASLALARSMGLQAPAGVESLEALTAAAVLALEAPDLKGLPAIGSAWDRAESLKALSDCVDRGIRLQEIQKKDASRILSQGWALDVLAARADLIADGTSWWKRLLSGRYKAAKRLVQSACTTPPPGRPGDLIAIADRLLDVQRLKSEIAERAGATRPLIGDRAAGPEVAWAELRKVQEWGVRFRKLIVERRLPQSLAEWVVGSWDRALIGAAASVARSASAAWRAAADRVRSALALPAGGRIDPEGQAFEAAEKAAGDWKARLDTLPSYAAYNRLYQSVLGQGLNEIAGLGHEGKCSPASLALVLEQTWAKTLLDRALRERADLRGFDATTHEQVVQRFRRADEDIFLTNRSKLADRHWNALPGPIAFGQVGILRRECAKKSRHLPIRQLMGQAGAAVQSAKPVFLMSPLSVASYLPPGGPTFDLIIFDEASQIRPVDAMGSILRGRQLVVVGDERQLPPTSFFDTMVSTEGVTEGEEDGPGTNITQDMQSILGLCTAQGIPSRMLRWHYRSRHDSLIALSNHEFYEDRLVLFPSPGRNLEGEGLQLRHVPNSTYERGTSRTNPVEADAISQAVLDHFRSTPDQTLGVVAFSQSQRQAIEDRLERLVRQHPDFDEWVRGNREEPFFVKNLENVQGDERDVMLISVGYGRDPRGIVSMNFGPLNQSGGERRLNVLITRARRRCIAFSNLAADDLDLRRAGGAGVRALKAFLAFAKNRSLDVPATTGREADSDFEVQVAAALKRAGYEIDLQVGSGGYRIDLAVIDPEAKGRYLIAIECDGASYHSARWARDRDRLRESVLRGLGWKIHRIWSADWFRNREEALRRCIAAIEGAKKERNSGPVKAAKAPGIERSSQAPSAVRIAEYQSAKVAAAIGDTHLAEIPTPTVAQFIGAIVEDEGPIHVEEVKRRVLEAIQARSGSKREAAIEDGVAMAVERALVTRRGDFLWRKKDILPRDRSKLPDASRKLDYVCDEECASALRLALKESCGCDAEEAAAQAIRMLGVKRNDEALARLKALFATLPSA